MRNRAFTLIELLVVISVIALLSSVVLAALNSARQKSYIARAKAEMYQFAKAAGIAQEEQSKTLGSITGSFCSDCGGCRTGANLIGTTGSCYTTWVADLTAVQNATNGLVTGLTNMTRDPWGSPYTLDENQGEGGVNGCTTMDALRSVGPNGIWGDSDDITSTPMPFSTVCP